MTGFIRGLFGGNKDKAAKQTNEPKRQRSSDAFFLDPDDAKTLGDAEFMRRPFEIERSFPKVRDNPGFSIKKRVTSTTEIIDDGTQPEGPSTSANNGAAPTQPDSSSTPSRRSNTDTSMDMFRKMAKQIKR